MAQKGRWNADEQIALSLACGATVENAARQSGVGEMTAYRRLREPEFKARFQAIRSDMVERTAAMLTAASLESVKTLLELQGPNNPPAVRHGAARSVLDQGVKLRESSELITRIASLEAEVRGTGG